MRKIPLSKIIRIHTETMRFEQELDLAPINVPERELIPFDLLEQINMVHPLIVVGGDEEYFCIARTSLYRWMVSHLSPDELVCCVIFNNSYPRESIRRQLLIERLVSPALFQTSPQQIKILYECVCENKMMWPANYRSYAHLSRITGVKVVKGIKLDGRSSEEL